jgi:hypothetical protein
MNSVSLDVIGAWLPLAATNAYLPRTLNTMNVFTTIAFALSVVTSSGYSYCDANGVHVVPGTMLLCLAVWLPRARGYDRSVPAAMIFALTFIAEFPVYVYGAFSCHASNGLPTLLLSGTTQNTSSPKNSDIIERATFAARLRGSVFTQSNWLPMISVLSTTADAPINALAIRRVTTFHTSTI